MKGKKLLASLVAAGMLSAAFAMPAIAQTPAVDEAPGSAAEASAAPVSEETAPPVAVPAGEAVPISDEIPVDEPEGSAVPISDDNPIDEPEGSAVPISDDNPAEEPSGSAVPINDAPTGEPGGDAIVPLDPVPEESASTISAPAVLDTVTLADLTAVAEYISGKGELTAEQMQLFDLNGSGTVTLTDLTQMAAIYAQNEQGATLPEPDPAYATKRIIGKVVSVEADEDTVYVKEDAVEDADEIGAILADDCVVIDCETAEEASISDLKEGDKVEVYIGMEMMPSLPPKATCYAVITNVPEELGLADYVRVAKVEEAVHGGVVVLNQNADLYVTIPKDLEIGILGTTDTASLSDIKEGTRLIVWYDYVLESYPAQTTALRCVLVPGEQAPSPVESDDPEASASPEASVAETTPQDAE